MAQKPYVADQQQRERRQQSYLAAPVLAKEYPAVGGLSVELRFSDPRGKATPSPHKRKFAPAMRAYFDFPCPLSECSGGGFNLDAAIFGALSGRSSARSGRLSCQGHRQNDGSDDHQCRLELQYQVTVFDADTAAA